MEWIALRCLSMRGGDALSQLCLSILTRTVAASWPFHDKESLTYTVLITGSRKGPFLPNFFDFSMWWSQWAPRTTTGLKSSGAGLSNPSPGPLSVPFMLIRNEVFLRTIPLGLGPFLSSLILVDLLLHPRLNSSSQLKCIPNLPSWERDLGKQMRYIWF